MTREDVAIVGAGLAGLTCGVELHRAGVGVRIYEASDGVGGRVRTDVVDGFRLDRGFQVLLTAYPEVRRLLDREALALRSFYPGAKIFHRGGFSLVADPFRHPVDGARSLANRIGTPVDKLRVAKVRARVRAGEVETLFRQPERRTREALREDGFSDRMVEHFFRPFLGGITLDPMLETTSRMYEFVMRMMSEDDIAIPAAGMGAISAQLAAMLRPGTVHLNSRIDRLSELDAKTVVVATEGPTAARLLEGAIQDPGSRAAVTMYFTTPEPPARGPYLMLDGEGRGPALNVTVLSEVAPEYAPAGRSLVSVAIAGPPTRLDDRALAQAVRAQLVLFFGAAAASWEQLATYRIAHGLPEAPQRTLEPPCRPARLGARLFVCGDHRENASIDGAMRSGRRAAEAVLESLS